MKKLILVALTAVALAFTVPQVVRTAGFDTILDATSVNSDICVENAAGPCLQNEAASSTNPTVIPNKTDPDTGIGHSGPGDLRIIIDGVTRAVFTSVPNIGGWDFGSSTFGAALGRVATMLSGTMTATVPGFFVQDDPNTGIGSSGADQLSLIAGGVEGIRVTTTQIEINVTSLEQENGDFSTDDDAQSLVFVLRNQTTDDTQTEIFTNGSTGDIAVASDCTISFRINIVARRTDADNESAAYFFEGAIDNNAGTTALVNAIGKVIVAEDNMAWDATVTADDTNDSINILVTGESAKTINWVARAETAEVCG